MCGVRSNSGCKFQPTICELWSHIYSIFKASAALSRSAPWVLLSATCGLMVLQPLTQASNSSSVVWSQRFMKLTISCMASSLFPMISRHFLIPVGPFIGPGALPTLLHTAPSGTAPAAGSSGRRPLRDKKQEFALSSWLSAAPVRRKFPPQHFSHLGACCCPQHYLCCWRTDWGLKHGPAGKRGISLHRSLFLLSEPELQGFLEALCTMVPIPGSTQRQERPGT